MKGCHLLEEYLEGDILGKIYNNNFNLAEQQPITKEYIRIKGKKKNSIKRSNFTRRK